MEDITGDADGKFDLPRDYGDNKVTLMMRDPWTLYAYWEIKKDIDSGVKEEIQKQGLAAFKTILRICEATESIPDTGPDKAFYLELEDGADSRYIHVSDVGRAWRVEIGILCVTGKFFTLARSNVVRTPAASCCDRGGSSFEFLRRR